MKKQVNDYIECWKSVILRWVLKRHASMFALKGLGGDSS